MASRETQGTNYCLITPAHNEGANLPRLFESIDAQTIRPVLWVIVNDGSRDRTKQVIEELVSKTTYIRPVHLTRNEATTYYSRKIHAFNEGYNVLRNAGPDYSFLGNLDADMSMSPDYYESILHEFTRNVRLGIAGGAYRFSDDTYSPLLHEDTVPGSILMFRRACYEDIGGYLPLRYGAEDTLACVMARHRGWETKLLWNQVVIQHRVVGTANNTGILKARFRQGLSEYDVGYHPLFSFIKCVRRCCVERPFVIGSVTRFIGYLCGPIVLKNRACPTGAKASLRREQWQRIFHARK